MLSTAAIAWLPWRAESFARARAEGRPVLLSLAPTWCGHSAEMDSATFADTEVAALVTAHFVAIRVDPDRRPDIAERYSLGGWPTTAFLTPDGDVLGGGTFIERQRLADVLRRVSAAFAQGSGLRAARNPPAPAVAPGEIASPEQLIDRIAAAFDPRHGGFGSAPKFPHAAPVRLALQLYREGGSPSASRHRGDDARRDGLGAALRRERRRLLPLRAARRLGRAERREAARRERVDARSLRRCRRDSRARALPRTGRGHPPLRSVMAGRSGGRRMGGIPARRSRLPRR